MPRFVVLLILSIASSSYVPAGTALANLFADQPLRFEDLGTRGFVARGPNYGLSLAATHYELRFDGGRSREHLTLRTRLVGASKKAQLEGMRPAPVRTSYFLGSDPHKWANDVLAYEEVRVDNAYPGIDLLFHGNSGTLEYDFVVNPGSDPAVIHFEIRGAKHLRLDSDDNLLLETSAGSIRWNRPDIYQEIGGARKRIAGRFRVQDDRNVGFTVGQYDRSRTLVIDPTLAYATYFGGTGNDAARAVATDAAGNVYVAGLTSSSMLPVTSNAIQATYGGETFDPVTGDVFVAKFTPAGALAYVTYLGGKGDDIAGGVAVDAAGNAYVTGYTNSANFPTTKGALQGTFAGFGGNACNRFGDAFVAKLDPSGTQLIYSTYLGGTRDDAASAIAIDSDGNAYIAGGTLSTDFPTTAGVVQKSFAGLGGQLGRPSCNGAPAYNTGDVFVAKLNQNGSQLVFSTYLGGSKDDAAWAIALDSARNVYVAGATLSSNFPTTSGAFQTAYKGTDPQNFFFHTGDGFVTKLSANGTTLIYSTLLGGTGDDIIYSIAVDNQGTAYVAGSTSSTDFLTTSQAVQKTYAGYYTLPFLIEQLWGDAFAARLDSSGTSLLYSTYLGGLNNDAAFAISVDSNGLMYVSGSTDSPNFPVTPDALQKNLRGDTGEAPYFTVGDGFFTIIDPNSNKPVYSTYFGGTMDDAFGGQAMDANGNLWLVGITMSSDLAVTPGASQSAYGGFRSGAATFKGDAMLVKFSDLPSLRPSISASGVVDGASFIGGGLVPGEIATVFGSNLTSATGINLTSSLPLPNEFVNSSVLVNGQPAPLFAVDNLNGTQQINFQVPWGVAGTSTATIAVSNNGTTSAAVMLPVLPAHPGIFTYSAGGKTFAAILHANFQLADTDHPAVAGETVLIYCTGLGAVAVPPADGAAGNGQETKTTPEVTIGGLSAAVNFSGLAPGFVGLNQINAVVPSGVASGNQPVVVTLNGFTSNSPLLPIR